MDLIVDSGPFKSVMPVDMVPEYPTLGFAGNPPRMGRTASGAALKTKGRKVLTCGFQAGQDKTLEFLTMNVTRALGSVSQMVANGCRVVFDAEDHGGSFIEHRRSGEKHRIHARNGVYVLPIWVREPASGFPGPAPAP